MINDPSIVFQQERVGELQTDKFNGCKIQLWEDVSGVRVPIHYGNFAATITGTFHMMECVAGKQKFSHDRFVSGLFESRLGDCQNIPIVLDNLLVYSECLIFDLAFANAMFA